MEPFSGGSRECPGKLLWQEQHGPPLQPPAARQPAPVLADRENVGKEEGRNTNRNIVAEIFTIWLGEDEHTVVLFF